MNDLKDEETSLDSMVELIFYAAISVIFVMIIALMVKLLWSCDDDGGGEGRVTTERTSLLPSKMEGWFVSYGTSDDDDGDIESTAAAKRSRNSSSDELYDGKICVICYDDERSCSFIPCRHSITCYSCAKRIIGEETKSCPICRTFIDKVRKLQI